MMPTVSSVVPFHMLGNNDHNEIQHDFSGHVISKASSMAPMYVSSQDNQNEVHNLLVKYCIDAGVSVT